MKNQRKIKGFISLVLIFTFAFSLPLTVSAQVSEPLQPQHYVSFDVTPAISAEESETQDGNLFVRVTTSSDSVITVDIDTQNISSLTRLWVYLAHPGNDTTVTLFRYDVARDDTPENWGTGIITVTHELNELQHTFYSVRVSFRGHDEENPNLSWGASIGTITITEEIAELTETPAAPTAESEEVELDTEEVENDVEEPAIEPVAVPEPIVTYEPESLPVVEVIEAPAPVAPVIQPANTATVTNAHFLNLRRGAGVSYHAFAVLARGDTVTILGHRGGWVNVETARGTGWVFGRYLDI